MSDTAWGIIISIIGGGIISALVGWWSTRSAKKDLRNATTTFASYLGGLIKGNEVKLRLNKKGEVIGVGNVVIPKTEKVGIREPEVVVVLKKANEAERTEEFLK